MLIVIGNGICVGYLLVRTGQGDSLLSDGILPQPGALGP